MFTHINKRQRDLSIKWNSLCKLNNNAHFCHLKIPTLFINKFIRCPSLKECNKTENETSMFKVVIL